MRDPSPHPFLAARTGEPDPDSDAVIVGLPWDASVSFRAGAAEAPSGIRYFSESVESWSPRTGRDLEDLDLLDAGDLEDLQAMSDVLDRCWRDEVGPLLVCLGGDHSVTPPIVGAVAARRTGLVVVGFDAHLDLRATYPGEHACTFRRISDSGVPCSVAGVRSGSREEWAEAPELLVHHSTELELPGPFLDVPVYLTLDIDVLDPSVAPGTGTPEPGGAAFNELLEAIEALDALNVVAVDVVEVAPPLDPSGITQAAAAVLVRELVLRFA